MFEVGQWVIVTVNDKKFKGYILRASQIDSLVNVWIPVAKTYNPHMYNNIKLTPYPLEAFDNSSEMLIDASLLLGCKKTFQEVVNNETIK